MTEEQKRAEKELEKTLNTLSEEELDALSGGKVTDDVREFFRTEKGKKVMKYTAIIGGTAVGVGVAAIITAAILDKKRKKIGTGGVIYEETNDHPLPNGSNYNDDYPNGGDLI